MRPDTCNEERSERCSGSNALRRGGVEGDMTGTKRVHQVMMKRSRRWLLILSVALTAAAAGAQGFLSPLFPLKPLVQFREVPQGEKTWVAVQLKVEAPFHIQANPATGAGVATELELKPPAGLTTGKPVYPKGKLESFAGLDELSVYAGEVRIPVQVTVSSDAKPGPVVIPAKLRYQACDDRGRCKGPRTVEFKLPLTIVPKGRQPVPGDLKIDPSTGEGAPPGQSEAPPPPGTVNVKGLFARHGLVLGLALIFLLGMAINLTPCVLPIIPVTIGFFGMQSGNDRRKTFALAASYVLGMAIMYSSLGVAAALLGKVFGFASQSKWVYVTIAIILAGLSLSMFGLYDLRPPARLTQARGRPGLVGALLMGIIVGIVAAPCSGPVVLGLVSFAAHEGNPLVGFGLFLTLALGLGLPYLVLGAFTGMASAVPRSGPWTEMTKRVFGVLMMFAAVYFLGQALPAGVAAALRAGYWLAIGIYFVAGDAHLANVRRIHIFKLVLGSLAALYGVVSLIGVGSALGKQRAVWPPVSASALAEAGAAHKPAIIDFGAEWCGACRELEEQTFPDPQVRAELARFAHFKADLTQEPAPGDFLYELRQRYQVGGLPVVVFLDSAGQELTNLRLTAFEPAEQFLRRLQRVPRGSETAAAPSPDAS
jgi:thiol:disulfide interchange protein DsbD